MSRTYVVRTPTVTLTQSTSGSTHAQHAGQLVRRQRDVLGRVDAEADAEQRVGDSPRIAAITRSSTATPSPRGFVRGERNCSSR